MSGKKKSALDAFNLLKTDQVKKFASKKAAEPEPEDNSDSEDDESTETEIDFYFGNDEESVDEELSEDEQELIDEIENDNGSPTKKSKTSSGAIATAQPEKGKRGRKKNPVNPQLQAANIISVILEKRKEKFIDEHGVDGEKQYKQKWEERNEQIKKVAGVSTNFKQLQQSETAKLKKKKKIPKSQLIDKIEYYAPPLYDESYPVKLLNGPKDKPKGLNVKWDELIKWVYAENSNFRRQAGDIYKQIIRARTKNEEDKELKYQTTFDSLCMAFASVLWNVLKLLKYVKANKEAMEKLWPESNLNVSEKERLAKVQSLFQQQDSIQRRYDLLYWWIEKSLKYDLSKLGENLQTNATYIGDTWLISAGYRKRDTNRSLRAYLTTHSYYTLSYEHFNIWSEMENILKYANITNDAARQMAFGLFVTKLNKLFTNFKTHLTDTAADLNFLISSNIIPTFPSQPTWKIAPLSVESKGNDEKHITGVSYSNLATLSHFLIGAFNFRALLPNSKESILENRIRTIIISDYDDLWYLHWKEGNATSPTAIHHYIESAARFQETGDLVKKYSNIYHKSDALDILTLRSSSITVNPLLGESEAAKRRHEISKAQNTAMIIFLNRLTIGLNNYYDVERNWIAPLGTMPCDGTEKTAMDILLREDVKASPDALAQHINTLKNKADKLKNDIQYLTKVLLDTPFMVPQTFRETYWTGIKKWPISVWNFVIEACLHQVGLIPLSPNSTFNQIRDLLNKLANTKIPQKHGNAPKFTQGQISQTRNLAEFEIRDFKIAESDDTIPLMHVNVADILDHLKAYYHQIQSQVSLLPLQLAKQDIETIELEINKSERFYTLLTSNILSEDDVAELELLKQEAFSPKLVKPRPSEFTFYSYTPELNKHTGSFVTIQLSVSPHAQTNLQLGQSGHMMDFNLKQHPNAGVYEYTTKDVHGRNVTLTSERRNFSWWSKTDKSGTKQKNSKMVKKNIQVADMKSPKTNAPTNFAGIVNHILFIDTICFNPLGQDGATISPEEFKYLWKKPDYILLIFQALASLLYSKGIYDSRKFMLVLSLSKLKKFGLAAFEDQIVYFFRKYLDFGVAVSEKAVGAVGKNPKEPWFKHKGPDGQDILLDVDFIMANRKVYFSQVEYDDNRNLVIKDYELPVDDSEVLLVRAAPTDVELFSQMQMFAREFGEQVFGLVYPDTLGEFIKAQELSQPSFSTGNFNRLIKDNDDVPNSKPKHLSTNIFRNLIPNAYNSHGIPIVLSGKVPTYEVLQSKMEVRNNINAQSAVTDLVPAVLPKVELVNMQKKRNKEEQVAMQFMPIGTNALAFVEPAKTSEVPAKVFLNMMTNVERKHLQKLYQQSGNLIDNDIRVFVAQMNEKYPPVRSKNYIGQQQNQRSNLLPSFAVLGFKLPIRLPNAILDSMSESEITELSKTAQFLQRECSNKAIMDTHLSLKVNAFQEKIASLRQQYGEDSEEFISEKNLIWFGPDAKKLNEHELAEMKKNYPGYASDIKRDFFRFYPEYSTEPTKKNDEVIQRKAPIQAIPASFFRTFDFPEKIRGIIMRDADNAYASYMTLVERAFENYNSNSDEVGDKIELKEWIDERADDSIPTAAKLSKSEIHDEMKKAVDKLEITTTADGYQSWDVSKFVPHINVFADIGMIPYAWQYNALSNQQSITLDFDFEDEEFPDFAEPIELD